MIYKMYYHHNKNKGWGRWTEVFGELHFEEANHYMYPEYPPEADLSSVENYYHYDNNQEYYDAYDFYYGHKEAKKYGLDYEYPDPEVYNNL